MLFVLCCLKPLLMMATMLLNSYDEKTVKNAIFCIRVVVLNMCIFLPKYRYDSIISSIISVSMLCV